MVSTDLRRCPQCGRVMPPDAFARDRHKASGRKTACRECDRARSADYYARVRGPRKRAARAALRSDAGTSATAAAPDATDPADFTTNSPRVTDAS